MTSISHILSTRLRIYLRVWVEILKEPEEVVKKSVVCWAQREHWAHEFTAAVLVYIRPMQELKSYYKLMVLGESVFFSKNVVPPVDGLTPMNM